MAENPSFYTHRPHPWHGLSAGIEPPRRVQAYIEITSFDMVKYELDKETGYLRVDRPQRTSSLPPNPYGFVPRTFCGVRVAKLAGATEGDNDPLDICVICERPINRSEVLLNARVIGGLCTLDHGAADDKIIAVLEKDSLWAGTEDIHQLPPALVERLEHYFATYKLVRLEQEPVEILAIYGQKRATEVVKAAMADYEERYGQPGDPTGPA